MTARDDIRILPSAALTATLIALVAWAVQHQRAAMWAVVVALVLAVAALFTVAIEAGREKARADDAERLAGDLADKLGATEVERDIAADLLAQREADARVVVPIRRCSCGHPTGTSGIHNEGCEIWADMPLRSVPTQRESTDDVYDHGGQL
jgi:hypothetical protein